MGAFVYPDAIVNHPLDYDVAQNFFDSDGDALSFKIQLKGTTTGVWRGLHLSGTHIVGIPTVAFPGERPQTGIVVEVDDGRGGGLFWEYPITIEPNAVPVVVQPNEDRILGVGASVDLEVTHGGSGFEDADDDPLTYSVTLTPASRGLRVEGTRVVGVLNSTGAVFVRVKADDGFGGIGEDVFALAAPVVETRRPTLPATPFIYDDAQLTLPAIVRSSRADFAPLWDTTQDSGNPTTNAARRSAASCSTTSACRSPTWVRAGPATSSSTGFAAPEAFSAGPQGELTKRNVMGLTAVRYNFDNWTSAMTPRQPRAHGAAIAMRRKSRQPIPCWCRSSRRRISSPLFEAASAR